MNPLLLGLIGVGAIPFLLGGSKRSPSDGSAPHAKVDVDSVTGDSGTPWFVETLIPRGDSGVADLRVYDIRMHPILDYRDFGDRSGAGSNQRTALQYHADGPQLELAKADFLK